jgi:hypothetical protein
MGIQTHTQLRRAAPQKRWLVSLVLFTSLGAREYYVIAQGQKRGLAGRQWHERKQWGERVAEAEEVLCISCDAVMCTQEWLNSMMTQY